MAQILLLEGAAPATPAANTVALYVKSDGLVYSKDDVGTETAIAQVFATNAEYVTGTDTTKALNSATARARNLVAGTSVATTSGTSVDFTGIPTWVKRITFILSGVSTNGTSQVQLRVGSGSIVAAGYVSVGVGTSGSAIATSSITTGLPVGNTTVATDSVTGVGLLVNISGNNWVYSFTGQRDGTQGSFASSNISGILAGALDRVRLTTTNGTDVFDAGSINIIYE